MSPGPTSCTACGTCKPNRWGIVVGDLTLNGGANFIFSATDTLTANSGTVSFGGFDLTNLIGLDDTVAIKTYTLIGGTATFNLDNVSNLGFENRVGIGDDKEAYFREGSLELVVIPEPATSVLLLLGAVAGLGLLRRKLHG